MIEYYRKEYFDSEIFNYDYGAIANAIQNVYHPKTVIEFGCGNGELSKAFSRAGPEVTALDGYSEPNFSGFDSISFYNVDLNNPGKLSEFILSNHKKYDIAVCMEVAEHLKPEVSKQLVDSLSTVSDIIIFSAAVPEQGGDGHINCRSREFWHQLFEQNKFLVADTIREKIRNDNRVAKWYKLNTIDYVKSFEGHKVDYHEIIKRLVASESESASSYYNVEQKLQQMRKILNFPIISTAFKFRNSVKKFLGRKPVVLP